MAAAALSAVELGTRIIVGRALLVLYTIPVPVRGFLSAAGVIGRDCGRKAGSLITAARLTDRGVRGTGAGGLILAPADARCLSVCDEDRLLLLETLRADGARRLLCEDLGWRPDAKRRGRGTGIGTGVLRDELAGLEGRVWPRDALCDNADTFVAVDSVRSLG